MRRRPQPYSPRSFLPMAETRKQSSIFFCKKIIPRVLHRNIVESVAEMLLENRRLPNLAVCIKDWTASHCSWTVNCEKINYSNLPVRMSVHTHEPG